MYKIERNGVVIEKESGTGKYPFLTMEVGDRFRVPVNSTNRLVMAQRVSKSAVNYARDYGRKFTTWTCPDRKFIFCKRIS